MQIDKPTDKLIPCVCGRQPTHFSIGYSRTPYYVGCTCGRLVDEYQNEDALIEAWNSQKEKFE